MLDIINVMTVDPGFGGQSFLSGMVAKIKQLRAMADAAGRSIDIEVDGGINTDTVTHAVQAGANVLVAGTSVFGYKDGISAGISALRQTLAKEID